MAWGSSNAPIEWAKETRCLARLLRAFFGSHVKATVNCMHKCAYSQMGQESANLAANVELCRHRREAARMTCVGDELRRLKSEARRPPARTVLRSPARSMLETTSVSEAFADEPSVRQANVA